MKTAISISDNLYKAADHLAKRMHVSRSQLYASAVAKFVSEHTSKDVTKKLNEVYSGNAEESRLPAELAAFQIQSIGPEEW